MTDLQQQKLGLKSIPQPPVTEMESSLAVHAETDKGVLMLLLLTSFLSVGGFEKTHYYDRSQCGCTVSKLINFGHNNLLSFMGVAQSQQSFNAKCVISPIPGI